MPTDDRTNSKPMAKDKREVVINGFRCLGPTLTPERILELRRDVLHNEALEALRRVLHALSGRLRLRILYLLHREPELCVCDLADILGESVSAVSHQLRILREQDLVRTRRDGKTVFYSLNEAKVRRYLPLHLPLPLSLSERERERTVIAQ